MCAARADYWTPLQLSLGVRQTRATMTIELAQALYRLGRLPPDTLGALGVELLTSGIDSPGVRELAWLSESATWAEVGKLFDRVLEELGKAPISERAAAYVVAEVAARDIVAGRTTPYEGAARIAYTSWHAAGMPDELTGFYFWADEWEDHPEYRDACEQDIRREAQLFLASRGVESA